MINHTVKSCSCRNVWIAYAKACVPSVFKMVTNLGRFRFGVSMAVLSLALALCSSVAAPGDGIKLGNTVIRPSVDLTTAYDSNVKLSPTNELDDVAYTEKLSIDLENMTDSLKLSGKVWGLAQQYSDLSDEDHEDFGQKIGLIFGDEESSMLSINQSFQSIQDLDYSVGKIQSRDNFAADAALSKCLSDKIDAEIKYNFKSTDYESKGTRSWDENTVIIDARRKVSDKSFVTLEGQYGIQGIDIVDEDADFITTRIGVMTRSTDKLHLDAKVGYRMFDTGAGDVDGFSFSAGGSLKLSDKLSTRASAGNRVEPDVASRALNGTFKTITDASIALDGKLSNTLKASVSAIYRDYDIKGARSTENGDNGVSTVSARIDYRSPAKFLKLFAEQKFEDKSSDNNTDYTQSMTTIGATLTY